jgi:di-N-acetylchitobiase
MLTPPPTQPGSEFAKNYTSIVSQTSKAMHREIRGSEVSVDVPWSPYNVDGRNYDWLGLAKAADILFIMAYDMQSQVRWARRS